jgi:glutaredoxin-related protein
MGKTQFEPKGWGMYRILVIAGLCALAIIVTLGELGRSLHADHKAPAGQRRHTRYAQQQARLHFPAAVRPRRQCHHCAFALADLSLSDATFDGVTITNHSKNTLQEITFEVTIKDCRPGYDPANAADRCVIVARQSKDAVVFIPPGQARGFHSQMNFHGAPPHPQDRRFFSWRIVAAKGKRRLDPPSNLGPQSLGAK